MNLCEQTKFTTNNNDMATSHVKKPPTSVECQFIFGNRCPSTSYLMCNDLFKHFHNHHVGG
jgi:hypothetical protein